MLHVVRLRLRDRSADSGATMYSECLQSLVFSGLVLGGTKLSDGRGSSGLRGVLKGEWSGSWVSSVGVSRLGVGVSVLGRACDGVS